MLTAVKHFFAWLSNCIYPRGLVCICCGKELSDDERAGEICFDCASRLPFRTRGICSKCGENIIGGKCPCCDGETDDENRVYYDEIVAPMSYAGAPRKWILDYKDAGKSWLAENISQFMAESLEDVEADVITYVPTVKSAVRKRGFDNSEYLAKATAKRLNLPIEKALVRVSQVKDSPDLSRKERFDNIKNRFKVSDNLKAVALKDKNVILVDDVLTTGATASECSRLLKMLGAKKVTVAVLCRTELKHEN